MTPKEAILTMDELEARLRGDEKSLHESLDRVLLDVLKSAGGDLAKVARHYKKIKENFEVVR